MKSTSWLFVVALTLFMGGCDSVFDPALPAGTVGFAPPPAYQLWWSLVQECSGRPGRIQSVDWYVVPGDLDADGSVEAYWSPGGNRIVLTSRKQMDGSIIRHEILHALVREDRHSRRAFIERCGGVVLCNQACIRDAGADFEIGTPIETAPPGVLQVDLEVRPAIPDPVKYDGYFAVIVRAHNPLDHWLAISPMSLTFQVFIYASGRRIISQNVGLWDAELRYFAPGETKQHVFDFRASPTGAGIGGIPSPGMYEVAGGFDGHSTARRPLIIEAR